MNSESLEHQQRCIDIAREQAELAKKENLPEVEKAFYQIAEFGISHQDAIKEFGKFPSRNKLIGRQSTQAKEDYIKNGGYW